MQEALARGDPAPAAELLAKLRGRYDEAIAFGITRNRHRDWRDGNHSGYTLGRRPRDYAYQVWPCTVGRSRIRGAFQRAVTREDRRSAARPRAAEYPRASPEFRRNPH